jgi:UDPglucose--hexose-1-phosphate uridylyltransferase
VDIYNGAGQFDPPEYDPNCPFCPGNEERFTLQVVEEKKDSRENWITRVIANKYKLFGDFHTCSTPGRYKRHGIYSYCDGCGNHLVVIEGRCHNRPLGIMSLAEIRNTLASYLDACRLMKSMPNNHITIIYKNQGARAGASQGHAHSQIVGSCIIPNWINNAINVQDKFFYDYSNCALCSMIDFEISVHERVIFEAQHLVVLSPFAASAPYEIWIVPKRHFCCYEDTTEVELTELALALKNVLSAYHKKLGNPDFNYFIHTAPHLQNNSLSLHLYLQISPRLTVPGGFETGTRIPVNTVWPEDVPKLLEITS